MSVSISTLPENFRIVSDTSGRDSKGSSSADLFAKIVLSGKEITTSSVKDFEKWAVIHGVKMNLWRNETGDVSNTAMNSSAHLGMDDIQFTLPCSDVDIAALETTAQGKVVDITFMKTANIQGHNVKIEEFAFLKAQIVGNFFFIQTGQIPSITISFKAKNIKITRYSYNEADGTAKGQKAYEIDFVTNTSKA
jgi:hypothetical protein